MIDNANRAGVVAYMTVQEFQRARPQDDRHVERVLKHKTVNTHGPAQIVLTDHLYNHLQIFFEKMRSQLPTAGPTEVDAKFFSHGGKRHEIKSDVESITSHLPESWDRRPYEPHAHECCLRVQPKP